MALCYWWFVPKHCLNLQPHQPAHINRADDVNSWIFLALEFSHYQTAGSPQPNSPTSWQSGSLSHRCSGRSLHPSGIILLHWLCSALAALLVPALGKNDALLQSTVPWVFPVGHLVSCSSQASPNCQSVFHIEKENLLLTNSVRYLSPGPWARTAWQTSKYLL